MKNFVLFSFLCVSAARAFIVPDGGRIWNGEEAEPHIAPYMIQLNHIISGNEFHDCGAVLLNTRWVLTAAHCLLTPQSTIVVAGQHDVRILEPWEQRRTIQHHYMHENYCGFSCPFDIGLIYVNQPFVLDQYVQPIKLPGSEQIPTGIGRLFGWGTITNSGQIILPYRLQVTDKPILDMDICFQIWGGLLDPTNLCTGPLDGSTAACAADTGGPLVQFDTNGEPIVIGIVSWGAFPCGRPNAPNVYVRVSGFVDWIYRTVGLIDDDFV